MQYDDADYPPDGRSEDYYETSLESGAGNAAQNYGGPYTSVPLFGWGALITRRCSTASLIPILSVLVFCADVVLTFFAGFDLVDRGLNRPWVQFSLSLAVAFLYSALAVSAWVMFNWERVLRFRYHWVLGLGVSGILAWINFGVWGSWQTRFAGFNNSVSTTDGNAYTTWVAVNGVGVVGFMLRFAVLCLAQGIRHAYDRLVELQATTFSRHSGGKSLYQLLSGASFIRSRFRPMSRTARPTWNFAGTRWATQRARSNNLVV